VAAELARRGVAIEVLDLHQTSVGSGNAVEALTLVEHRSAHGIGWAAGRDRSVLTATLNAVIAAADAALRAS